MSLRRAGQAAILPAMPIVRYNNIWDYAKACGIWLLLGLSLGGYYLAGANWPVTSIEGAAAGLVFRYSSLSAMWPLAQGLYWLALVPVAGMLWVRILTITAPYYGGANQHYPWSLVRLAVPNALLVLPVLYLLWLALVQGGFHPGRVADLVLLQRWPSAPGWLAWVYLGLGIATVIWQFVVYMRVFGLRGKPALRHWLTSLLLFLLAATGLGVFLYNVMLRWIAPLL